MDVESARPTRASAGFWFGAAALYAIAVSIVLLVPPADLLGQEGGGVVVLLAVPVLLSVLALFARGQRILVWGCIALLGGFVLFSIASVGLVYLPGLVMIVVATLRQGR
ncbi:hypothetical protein M1L60_35165 [Actinoplanes sp. TRM 88003]|uniref:Uncharacterized protein n=1 Tax=Paractinoplanes aksuensis TaxID=2939490 RepID=A0ABT1DY72_9ACTN|nr:hypothetical protein [Actinoplanes aksuensis]MCO8275834.1 hypothetical protein [Actinoplanes aksuensis]